MRDIFTFWKRHYSAVSASEVPVTQVIVGGPGDANKCDDPNGSKGRRSSFLTGRKLSLDQGIPPIIDSFFYQRKSGEQTRQPKRNN